MLPLKLWRPQWFDGVALAAGAAAPDVSYLFDGTGWPVWPLSHQWLGVLVWNLPVAFLLTWLLRAAAPSVATHLPDVWALRDYGALARVRHPVAVTGLSAMIGAASHIVADDIEDLHPLLEPALTVVGVVAAVALARYIARHRLIRAWHGAAPVVPIRPVLFWTTAAAVAIPGAAVVPFLPAAFLSHTSGARLIAVITVALAVAAAVTTASSGAASRRSFRGR